MCKRDILIFSECSGLIGRAARGHLQVTRTELLRINRETCNKSILFEILQPLS